MTHALLITVRLHEGRYHGAGEWPPSPGRLFQALVAGAGLGGPLRREDAEALQWLEGCAPPVIASPLMASGQSVKSFVPNNDLDAVGGDPRRVNEIRTEKAVKPRIFDASIPFRYAWSIGDEEHRAWLVCALAKRLYQLGRGIDMAWAWGEVLRVYPRRGLRAKVETGSDLRLPAARSPRRWSGKPTRRT